MTDRKELLDCLRDLRNEADEARIVLSYYADIKDDPDGGPPLPNAAMSTGRSLGILVARADALLDKAEGGQS